MGLWWGGRCAAFLVAALALDAAGLALVLAGALGRPRLEDGASFEDFLVLSGALLLFLSLLCWLFWYSGNLRGIPDPEGAPLRRPGSPGPRPPPSLLRLAAKLSQRLSQRQQPRDPGPPALELSQRSPAAATASAAGPQERLV